MSGILLLVLVASISKVAHELVQSEPEHWDVAAGVLAASRALGGSGVPIGTTTLSGMAFDVLAVKSRSPQ